MKTICFVLTLAASTSTVSAASEFLNHVTTCVGRFSAQMEHHWLFQDMPTERIETQRSHLIDILETMVTHENASWVLSNRIESKLAHSALLTQAVFASNSEIRAYARARVDTQLQVCGDMLLAPPTGDQVEQVTISDVHSGGKLVNRSAVRKTRSQ